MSRNSAITKAVAPITGGASTAPVDAQASTAAAVAGFMPVRCIAGLVIVPVGGTPAEFHKKVLSDRARWAPVIKDSGIKMDA